MTYGLVISGALRAAIVLAAGLAAYVLLARSAAATRRFVLVMTLGAALVVPLAAAVGPRWRVDPPSALPVFAHESANEQASAATAALAATPISRTATAPTAETAATPRGGLDASAALFAAWLVIAGALLVRMARSQLRARALVRMAPLIDHAPWIDALRGITTRRMELRASAELDSPVVTGLLRPTIVVPRSALTWPVERCRLVLVHELAHVRRRDVLVQALADLACALQWCNPLVWLCARRLRVECELAADDAVLAAGVRPSRYAEELVAVATSLVTPRAALAMAERSSLETRVASILTARLARTPLATRGALAVGAVGAVLAAAAACASPQEAASRPVAAPIDAPRTGTATDPAIQHAAVAGLAAMAKEWAPELATIVVLDPATGEVLANAGLSAGKPADVASQIAIAPGSTLKPVTIAAGLELHAIKVDQMFECGPAPRVYGDKTLHDSSPNGTLDLAHLLAVSSNIGTSRIFDAIGGDNLGLWLRRFHFGGPPRVAGATAGTVPAAIASGSYEGAIVAEGGGLTATPLEMIAAYGVLASDGVYHAPTFDRGGSPAEHILAPETAHAVMSLLETAVTDPVATGKAARVEGVHVAGKTGTAVFTTPDGHEVTYASFIGVADLPGRRVVVLVGLQAARDDLAGGKTAAPTFARLVKRLSAR